MEKKEYRSLTVPRLSWKKTSYADNYGELVVQPLEPGFGLTLGNALRRILLGGIEGSAVTSVTIEGVNNEFSSLPGVVEDAMQMLLNVKGIVIRNKTGQGGTLRLTAEGEGPVYARALEGDDHLEVVNGDHVIANLSSDGSLNITFFVEPGRGYRMAQWPLDQSYQDDGKIHLDAMFSPIRRVMFDVEKTRVGEDIDYDKLILRLTTDGSETPADVLHYAVSVLRTQLEHFLVAAEIPFNEISTSAIEEQASEPVQLDELGLKGVPVDLLMKPIEELELSVRAHNCLINAGIKRVLDLVNLSEDDVLHIKNFGKKSLTEVRQSMDNFGLRFGMAIQEEVVRSALEGKK